MPTLTFDPSTDAPSPEQAAAETAALAQGEKLAQAAEQDRAARYAQEDRENTDVQLIGGKFKSQEDLLKAYQELQKKLGQGDAQEEGEEASEEPTEASEEAPEEQEEAPAAEQALSKAAEEYAKGQLTDATIEELSKMDSKDLIKAYVEFYSKNAQQYQQQAALQQSEQEAIVNIAGGQQGYSEMIQWAAQNLDQSEIDAYNSVTNSGNYAAIKFAAEALYNRFTAAEGNEAPLVTGKAPTSGVKPYRSQAELARDISDPRYHNDPAFRQDVEERLARSTDLL